jgi:mannose-6-phosphate isomerase
MDKKSLFSSIRQFILDESFRIHSFDDQRPWGGFFVINEEDASKFIDRFFPTLDKQKLLSGKLSPKILLVAPGKKLSWQYHHRRAEVWKLIQGAAAIVRSHTDVQGDSSPMILDTVVHLEQGERHRLVGTDQWGVVAEIWMHTDPQNPSDEEDIVRVEDDFGRN